MNDESITPRGIRNKNPGNVRHSPTFDWLHELQPDDGGFCRFPDPIFGLRVMYIIFHHYQEFAGLHSVSAMIARWAPNTENDTTDYARYVAARLRVAPDDPINFPNVWREFLHAVVAYENGQDPYPETTYNAAYQLAVQQR